MTAAVDTAAARPVGAGRRLVQVGALAGLALMVVASLVLFASFQTRTETGPLDPDSPTPEGSRALAVLLGHRNVAVEKVSSSAEALETARAGNVTVLVPFPYDLSPATVRALSALPRSVRVVHVEPDQYTLDEIDTRLRARISSGLTDLADPDCNLPEAVSAGEAEVALYRFDVTASATTCYDRGLVVLDRAGAAETVLLGSRDPLTNDRLDDAGNAALSLGLLTAHDRVLWLDLAGPEPAADAERAGLGAILPGWVGPVTWMLVAAGVLAAFWSGRRLGPPIAERLPVIVRSAETVEGRSRLYRRARARGEAHQALRAAALARVLPLLGLGPTPERRVLVEAVAERSRRHPAEVYTFFYGAPAQHDAGLVAAADDLDALVADTVDPTRNAVLPPDPDPPPGLPPAAHLPLPPAPAPSGPTGDAAAPNDGEGHR